MPRSPFTRRRRVHPAVSAAKSVGGALAATGGHARRAPKRAIGIATGAVATVTAVVLFRRRRASAAPEPAPWSEVPAYESPDAEPGKSATVEPPAPARSSAAADTDPDPADAGEQPNEGATGDHPAPGDEVGAHGAASPQAAEQPNEGATGDHPAAHERDA